MARRCQAATETQQILTEKLRAFDAHVAHHIPPSKKTALSLAEQRCPHLLTDAFKLKFLRTEILDVPRAARRYAHYWELRLRLFGEKAFERLTLTEEADVAALRSGLVQTVPGHERVLRVDTSHLHTDNNGSSTHKFSVESLARTQWYVCTKILQHSEDIQRYGGVFVIDLHGTFQSLDLLKQISEHSNDGFPLRCASACILNPPRFVGPLLKVAKWFLRPRVRDKIHVINTPKEFLDHVGVAKEELDASTHDHNEWVDRMLQEDQHFD